MDLIMKIKVENIFKSKDFTDKKTGVITEGKWKLQGFDNISMEDGSKQMKLIDISLPEIEAPKYQKKIGEVVELKVATYIANGRVGFYGIV